jgi:hypothetical protein
MKRTQCRWLAIVALAAAVAATAAIGASNANHSHHVRNGPHRTKRELQRRPRSRSDHRFRSPRHHRRDRHTHPRLCGDMSANAGIPAVPLALRSRITIVDAQRMSAPYRNLMVPA